MKVLLIGYPESKIKDFLSTNEDLFFIDGSEKITMEKISHLDPELIVLHGCHSILSKGIVKKYVGKIINCHGAYLPFNRGSHPNVWSIVDDTIKGGTIHFIDEDIDRGFIIDRREIFFDDEETLSSSYWKIRDLLEIMFIEDWDRIKSQKIYKDSPTVGVGTIHYRKDLKKIEHLLIDGWETKISDIKRLKNLSN